MTRRRDISFEKADSPITHPVTKFGGQPVWIGGIEWPLSRSANQPMRFICQVALSDVINDDAYAGKMVYLFMTDTDGTWDPEGGLNAVVLQSGGDCIVETSNISDGPTLQASEYASQNWPPDSEPVEYSVSLGESDDLSFDAFEEAIKVDHSNEPYEKLHGTKLGGTPGFVQGPDFPFARDKCFQVLQIDMISLPFYLDLGDCGVGHLFLELGTNNVRFQWACT